jgi:hypothetical protein
MLSVAVILLAGALRANTAAEFNRQVGWATIVSTPVAVISVVLLIAEKVTRSAARPEMSDAEAENKLAAVVLGQAEVQRSRLIGTDEVSDQAANVRFVKDTGRFREVGGVDGGDLASVFGYYQALSPGRLVVLGEPGAGKTVLALELLTQLLERRQLNGDIPVPVLISAAAYDTSVPWEKWLVGHLAQRFSMTAHPVARLVRVGRVLPMIDGLDEMDPPGDTQRAHALVMALNSFMRGRQRAALVVTCRRAEYQTLVRNVDRATHIEMAPLTADEAASYLSKEFLGQEERELWEPVLSDLHDNADGLLASQLATPWRLTLALAVFRAGGDPAELLPGPVSGPPGPAAEEYAQRVDALLLGRYVQAKAHLFSRDAGYTPQQVQRWLIALADGLHWQAQHNGSATDIQLDQWWRPTGQRATRLAHMAAVIVIALPWFIIAAIRHQPGLALIGATVLPFVAVAARAPRPHQLKLSELTTPRGLLRLLPRVATGLAAGLALGLTGRLAAGLPTGLTLALALAFTGTLVLRAEDSSPQTIGPRDVIRADRNFGLVTGLAFGLGGGLAGGLAGGFARWFAARVGGGLLAEPGGLALGLTQGLSLGLAFGLAFGAASSVRYRLSVVIGAVRGSCPPAFGAFLDWGARAGLLRLAGISYQFRHRQLQDWLTSRR